MKYTSTNLRYLTMAVGMLVITSCAQLPPNVSVGNKVAVAGTKAIFGQCHLSVRFTGSPRPLTPFEIATFTRPFSKFANYTMDGLFHEEYRLAETAICLCRDYGFSVTEINQFEGWMQANEDLKFIRSFSPAHSVKALEFESPGNSSDIVDHGQIFFPVAAPNCMFVQSVRFQRSTSPSLPVFLDTIDPAPARTSGSIGSSRDPQKSKTAAAQRLEELRDLSERGLITQEEYEQKRKEVLQGL